jgi:NADPH2:quinone reductase
LALHGFAMFYVSTDEQRVSADDINRWLSAKKLHIVIGKTFKIADAAAAHRFLEDNTLQKAGTLTGKVVLHP